MAYINEPYIKVTDGVTTIDRNMANFEIVNYKIVNNIYQSKCNVINELTQSGLNVTNDDDYMAPANIKLLTQAKPSFKELFDLYCQIAPTLDIETFSSMYDEHPDWRIELIERKNPLVHQAYWQLGENEVKRLKYHTSNINREIELRRHKIGTNGQIECVLPFWFKEHMAMPVKEVKEKLQNLYKSTGIQQTAKATDLKKWYEVKEHTKTIDGKSVACMTIIRSKFA